MIEAHVLDAWTRPADRQTLAYGRSAILAGFAAPMFLFLAGVSVALAASAGARKTGSAALAAARVRRRGWQVFGLAYLFRLQAYILNPKAMLSGVLKVDILNIMGPSIVAAAALWQLGRDYAPQAARARRRRAGGDAASRRWCDRRRSSMPLPGILQWYLRPTPGRNNFTFFPWTGFVFAGALVGVLLDRTRGAAAERRFTRGWRPRGAGVRRRVLRRVVPAVDLRRLAVLDQLADVLPAARRDRHGARLSVVYFWEQRPRLLGARWKWASPMVAVRPLVALRLLGSRRAGVRRLQRAAPREPALRAGGGGARGASACSCSAWSS